MRVGLTGNLACGKSTVAGLFAELGAEVIDADRIVHELIGPGGAAVGVVRAEFPELGGGTSDGIDRPALARIVFADPHRRRRLEQILHPLVIARTDELMAEAASRGAPLVVAEAALLFESAQADGRDPRARFDAIVVVTCDPDVRMARLRARTGDAGEDAGEDAGGGADANARARIAAQMSQAEKAERADHVIDNSGALEETRRQVRVIHSRLLPEAASGTS